MMELYTYEIATTSHNGRWERTELREGLFSRSADDIARGLLEQWINSNHNHLPGGRVFVYNRSMVTDPTDVVASVRIRVWRGAKEDRSPTPVAAAYLGHSVADVPHRWHFGWHWLPKPRQQPTAPPAQNIPEPAGSSEDMDLVDDDGTGAFPDWIPPQRTHRFQRFRRRTLAA